MIISKNNNNNNNLVDGGITRVTALTRGDGTEGGEILAHGHTHQWKVIQLVQANLKFSNRY